MAWYSSNYPQWWVYPHGGFSQQHGPFILQHGALVQQQQGFDPPGSPSQIVQPDSPPGGHGRGGGRQGRRRPRARRDRQSAGPRGPVSRNQPFQAQSNTNSRRRNRRRNRATRHNTETDDSLPNEVPPAGPIKPEPERDTHSGNGPTNAKSATSAEIERLEAALADTKSQLLSRERDLLALNSRVQGLRAETDDAQRENQHLQHCNDDLRLELDSTKEQEKLTKTSLNNSQQATKKAEESLKQAQVARDFSNRKIAQMEHANTLLAKKSTRHEVTIASLMAGKDADEQYCTPSRPNNISQHLQEIWDTLASLQGAAAKTEDTSEATSVQTGDLSTNERSERLLGCSQMEI